MRLRKNLKYQILKVKIYGVWRDDSAVRNTEPCIQPPEILNFNVEIILNSSVSLYADFE